MSSNGHNGEGLPLSLQAFMLSHLNMHGDPEPIQLPEKPFHSVPPEFHRNVPPELPAETTEGKTLKAMLDGGMSLDEAAAVLKSLGENSTGIPPEFHRNTVPDSTHEKRKKWDRERKRRKKLAAKKPAETPTGIPPESVNGDIYTLTSLPLEKNTRKESKRTGSTRARAHRLPDDWKPTDADLEIARTLLSADRIPIEIDKFRDYWHARGDSKAVSTNWSLNFRNWCRNNYGGSNELRSGTGLSNPRGRNQGGGLGNGAGAGSGQNRSRGGFSAFAVQSARRAAERMDGRGQHNTGEGVVELDSEPGSSGAKARTDR